MTDSSCVITASGTMQGYIENDVRCFLGIPFALPPVGELRFLPPQPMQPMQGIYDATYFRHSPMQFTATPLSGAYAQDSKNQSPLSCSEDCLYLNVWAPENEGTGGASRRVLDLWRRF